MTGDPQRWLQRHSASAPGERALGGWDDWCRLFVQGVQDEAIFLLALDGTIRTWNAGAERITGFGAEEVVGKPFTFISPEEERSRAAADEVLRRVAAQGRYELEASRLRKGGGSFWARVVTTSLVDDDGDLLGFAMELHDLTERRTAEQTLVENEARLSGIIASAMDAIISTDEQRRILVFNAAAERLFGVPAEEAIGTSLDQFLPERYRAVHSDHMRRFGETGVTTRSMHRAPGPLPALRRDGTEFPVEATISQAVVGGRRLFTVLLRDVTERVRVEEERNRAVQQAEAARIVAEEANRAKSGFLAAMSHELRTPLNAIAGYVDLLELGIHGPITEAQSAALERVRRNQRLLLLLINDILNFAKIEAGHTDLEISDVAVAELLAGLDSLIEPQVHAAQLSYACEGADASLRVRGDRERIEQILLNLLTNAVKFTDAGGSVGVLCGVDAHWVYIRVRDTGRGIPADMLEKIFDPFVQVDRHMHQRSQQGVGLGLAISRELARQMGGELSVASTLGSGSTFTVTLLRGLDGPLQR
jgi:PAS domain S-box-containing protein